MSAMNWGMLGDLSVTRFVGLPGPRWSPVAPILFVLAVALLAIALPLAVVPHAAAWESSLERGDDLSGAPAPRPCPDYRLLPVDDARFDCLPLGRGLALMQSEDTAPAGASSEAPEPPAPKEPRHLLAALVFATDIAATAANSTLGYEHEAFHVNHEGFYGKGTKNGGADKASHFVDYYVISRELTFVYAKLGYPESTARVMGLGTAIAGGIVNEVSDGFTRHGFSPEDLLMDVLGASTAALVSGTRTDDLVGFRTSHLPGPTFTHDVYSMDLKIAGLARRLGINIGPLRFLFLSATYGIKGYPDGSDDSKQRQVGIEIGLNLEEILNSASVRRDTWWGYALHMVADNVRFPYTAVGFRYDLNHSKWRGPNTGNY